MMCYLTTSEIRYVYGQSNRCINTAMINVYFQGLEWEVFSVIYFLPHASTTNVYNIWKKKIALHTVGRLYLPLLEVC